jgi:23S rRNA (adenine2030-N6)-methyltransferase
MLSYRHSYHAGNFADVLKHTVQILCIEALNIKPKPYVYFDTHAAAGGYQLLASKSQKIAEYKTGIYKLWQKNNIPAALLSYVKLINKLNPNNKLEFYPGSPLIAKMLMPKQYHIELTDLHPSDSVLLKKQFINDRNISVLQMDGYKNLLAKLPPIQRRALILIDPSYELKSEYSDCILAIKAAHKRFATGIYAIWYPVISRQKTEAYCQRFKKSGIRNILRIEMSIESDNDNYGMTGTGMIIINPPWKLSQQMTELMPWLLTQLKLDDGASFIIEQLVDE